MAVSFSEVRDRITLILYDYMLTSDEDAFWYSIAAIREALGSEVSGAFVSRAIDALESDDLIEEGNGDDGSAIYALTQGGLEAAEFSLRKKGIALEDYTPSPDADRILSRIDDAAATREIENTIDSISKELRENNEVAVALGDSKDIISGEIEAASVIVKHEQFRLRPLVGLLLPALRFLADKFVGQGIGELAKKLIDLLMASI